MFNTKIELPMVNSLPAAADDAAQAEPMTPAPAEPLESQPAEESMMTSVTTAEVFLEQNYVFRRNVLRDQVEYHSINEDETKFRPLTERSVNSIILASKHEMGEDVNIAPDIKLYVNSEEIEDYDPIIDYLDHLPVWDGKDRVVDFCNRIPGLTAEQIYFLSIWLRGVVASWKGLNKEHGNEVLPLFIGEQDCGKSTFVYRFLPEYLRKYYLDHFNLANKFDKEMALCGSLIVNIDEFDQLTTKQMAALKQALSKVNVNGRAIYGKTIIERARKASFFGTTNNRHPLKDPTGSRRFLCIDIKKGNYIDIQTEIEYDQLFAQIVDEVENQHCRYWYSHEEVARIQELNAAYQDELDLEQILEYLYDVPQEGDKVTKLTAKEVRKAVKEYYPSIKDSEITSIKLGKAMRAMNFQHKSTNSKTIYDVVLKKTA